MAGIDPGKLYLGEASKLEIDFDEGLSSHIATVIWEGVKDYCIEERKTGCQRMT